MLARLATFARLFVLAALAVYNLSTFHANLVKYASENAPTTYKQLPAWFRTVRVGALAAWPANWRMFTFNDPSQVFVDFDGYVGTPEEGEWERLPMERWFPDRWESG